MNDLIQVTRVFGPWDFQNAHNALKGKITQRDFAGFYADCIRASKSVTTDDWLALNKAVTRKWAKGLQRVKTLAWNELRER